MEKLTSMLQTQPTFAKEDAISGDMDDGRSSELCWT